MYIYKKPKTAFSSHSDTTPSLSYSQQHQLHSVPSVPRNILWEMKVATRKCFSWWDSVNYKSFFISLQLIKMHYTN